MRVFLLARRYNGKKVKIKMRFNLDFLTIFTLVKQSLINELSDNEIYMRLICLGGDNLDGKNDPHRHITGETQIKGSNNSSTIYKSSLEVMARTYDIIFADFMSVSTRKKMISALKTVLSSCEWPDPDLEIGEGSHMTRQSIQDGESFCFPLLLAGLIKFAVPRDNPHRKDFKEYREAVADCYRSASADNIDLVPISLALPDKAKIAKIDMKYFGRLFMEVKTAKLPEQFRSCNKINIFRLNIRNSLFDYDGLSAFLEENIEHYVMSALEEKSYYDEKRTKHLTHDAIKRFVESTSAQDLRDAYSRLMLYVFMECGLGAPKIFNAIEIKEKDIRSDGVYYLSKGPISDKPMLVLGASKTFETLDDAMENALDQVDVIVKEQDKALSFINPAFLRMRFEQDDLAYIVDRLIKAEGLLENDASFGIFLSYSLKESNDGSLSSEEFVKKVEERMQSDIDAAIPMIYAKIKEHGLQNYGFFVFILPLEEVEKDVKRVIQGFAGGERNG